MGTYRVNETSPYVRYGVLEGVLRSSNQILECIIYTSGVKWKVVQVSSCDTAGVGRKSDAARPLRDVRGERILARGRTNSGMAAYY
jgi:hypothetical protein